MKIFLHGLRKIDYIVLFCLPIIAILVSVKFTAPYLVSIFLFYALPGIYLSFRYGHVWQVNKGLIFAILVATPFAIIVDFIGTQSGLWYVPNTLFSQRFLGIIPWEDFVWMITATYTMIIIYETLFDKSKRELINKRMWYFCSSAFLVLGSFFLLLIFGNSQWLVFKNDYTYLLLGTVFFLLPAILFTAKFPKFIKKSLPLMGYFLYLTLLFEITATFLTQWTFSGTYISPVLNIFGNTPIPFEELFFVGFIGPLAAIAFYEFFDDDRK